MSISAVSSLPPQDQRAPKETKRRPVVTKAPRIMIASLSLSPFVPPEGAKVTQVQLSDLMPGMRLASPLLAVDGRTVLKESVQLNRSIVVQLWQLAAVRALKPSVSVYLAQ